MWRRWRWRGAGRWAGRGAALALVLLGLGLGGSGGGEELLAALLAAWQERGGDGGDPAGGAGEAGFAHAATFANGAGVANGANGANGAGVANGVNSAIVANGAVVANGAGVANDANGAIVANGANVANGAIVANVANGANGANVANGAIVANAADGADFASAAALADAAILAAAIADPSAPPQLLPPPPPCSPPSPFLLVLVPSAPSHSAQRQAVRDTWGGDPRPGGLSARTVFVLGVPAEPAQQAALAAERRRHGDLLQGPFADTYGNLTLKTLLLLRWAAARCPGSRFLLKADDDVFVNLPALTSHLRSRPRPRRLYLGRVHWRVRPARDPRSRHHVPAASFGGAAFPPYCSGTAYVLSRHAALAVLAAAPHVPMVAPEDVWVGLCARRAGVAPRHSARMAGAARFPPDRCCMGEVLFSAHGMRPPELRGVWAMLRGGAGEGQCGAVQRALGMLRCRALAAMQWVWGG